MSDPTPQPLSQERLTELRDIAASLKRVLNSSAFARALGMDAANRGDASLISEVVTAGRQLDRLIARLESTQGLPAQPPRELLVSMAMRLDHAFGMDKHEVFPGVYQGYTPEERAVKLADMARLYEEVSGRGFYCWGGEPDSLYTEVKVAPSPGDPQQNA